MKTIQIRQTSHIAHCLRNKDELVSDILLWTPSHGWAKAGQPARTYIKQLCVDIGCSQEDLLEVMDNTDGWWESVWRSMLATWWWWWYVFVCIYIYYLCVFVCIYIKLATLVKANLKAPFSVVHWGIGEGATLFPGLLHFTLDPFLIMLSFKQSGIKYQFLSPWYNSTWDWTPVSWAIFEHSTPRPFS